MTEAQWLACTDPQKMLENLRGKASDRKLRLFAVACCRRVWHLLNDERSRRSVEVAECHADAGVVGLGQAFVAADFAAVAALQVADGSNHKRSAYARFHATAAASQAARDVAPTAATAVAHFAAQAPAGTMPGDACDNPLIATERAAQADLLHDIFGTPFGPATINPAWLSWNDGTIQKLAQAIYDDRAFDRMPILADALEEAGCTDQDILSHCRSEGEHVRGCWVVDLILGRP